MRANYKFEFGVVCERMKDFLLTFLVLAQSKRYLWGD